MRTQTRDHGGPRRALIRALMLAILASGLGPSASAVAQESSAGWAQPGDFPFLLNLEGLRAVVRYTPGSLDRADRLLSHLEYMAERFHDWGDVRARWVALAMSPDEWRELDSGRPYGVPAPLSATVVAVPAWGSQETLAFWRPLVGGNLPVTGEFAVRGSPEERATLVLGDALMQLEFCRAFLELAGFSGEAPWIRSLLAHAVSLTLDGRRADTTYLTTGRMFLALEEGGGGPGAHTLTEYGVGLTPAQWLWFESQFWRGARVLWAEHDKKTVKKLLQLRRKKGAPLTWEDLAERYPELVEWRHTAFRPPLAPVP